MLLKLVLFDLDGTIYLSGKLLPGVKKLLQKISRSGLNYAFMTNNSSVNPDDYLKKLNNLGLSAEPKNIITSSEATCLMLADLRLGPKIFILGTQRFKKYLAENGYQHEEKHPSAVLVGFDLELTYQNFTQATRLIASGVPLVASHPDAVCPTIDGPLPDAGMLLAAIKAGTGVIPKAIAGKPNRWIIEVVKKHFNVKPGEIVMIGDRLQTDIRMANRFKMKSVLVLSGVTQSSDVKNSRVKPDLVVDSVSELTNKYWFGKLGWL